MLIRQTKMVNTVIFIRAMHQHIKHDASFLPAKPCSAQVKPHRGASMTAACQLEC